MNDAAQLIADFNAGRDPERLTIKYRNMRADVFVFLRGTCHLFYRRLPEVAVLQQAPLTWLCGDLHLQNFGSYKDRNRNVRFDINDYDEAALAPCTWDLVRLLTSMHFGLRHLQLSDNQNSDLEKRYLAVYARTVIENAPATLDGNSASGLIHELLKHAAERSRAKFLDTRTVLTDGQRRLKVDGEKALPLLDGDRQRIDALWQHLVTASADPAFFQILDAARRIAGTGSLGVERYVILVTGKGSPDGNYLLDLKRAVPSSLPTTQNATSVQWSSQAERIVKMQSTLQQVPVAFLKAVVADDHSYVLRGLSPSEDRLSLTDVGKKKPLQQVIDSMARLTAWAHLRGCTLPGAVPAQELIAYLHRNDWQKPLRKAARICVERTLADWQAYGKAFDDGFFLKNKAV